MKLTTVPFRDGRLLCKPEHLEAFTKGRHVKVKTLKGQFVFDPVKKKSVESFGSLRILKIFHKRRVLRLFEMEQPDYSSIYRRDVSSEEREAVEALNKAVAKSGLNVSVSLTPGDMKLLGSQFEMLEDMRRVGLNVTEPLALHESEKGETLYSRLMPGKHLGNDYANTTLDTRRKYIKAVAEEIANYHHFGFFRLDLDPYNVRIYKGRAGLIQQDYTQKVEKNIADEIGLVEAERFITACQKNEYLGDTRLFQKESDEKAFLSAYLKRREELRKNLR